MLKILGKLPWFEWLGLIVLAIALGSGYTLVKTYNKTVESNVTLESKNGELSASLDTEKKVAAVTDQVVFDYVFERELKIKEVMGWQATSLEEYFATRDNYNPTNIAPEKEKGNVDVSANGLKPPKTAPAKVVEVDTSPNPAAIGVLVNGMHRTYCRAYSGGDTCPTGTARDGLPTAPATK